MKSSIIKPRTSIDIVTTQDPDAFYFRRLEFQGIYLNEHQIEAVRSTDIAMLAYCSAGSGKSLSIIAKAGYLIEVEGIEPDSIFAITFTRKAADELKLRLNRIIPGSNVQASTMHGLCYRVLNKTIYRSWKLINSDNQRMSIFKWLMKCNKLFPNTDPEKLVTAYSYWRNTCCQLDKGLYESSTKLFDQYEDYKLSRKLYDFDDLLTTMLFILQDDIHLARKLQKQFSFILFDEVQDASPVILSIIKVLAENSHLHMYGDIRQSIYSFRGSDIRMIEEFSKQFTNTKRISFNYNYRSTADIAKLANSIINQHIGCFEDMVSVSGYSAKPIVIKLEDQLKEAQYVIDRIYMNISQRHRQYSDHAILYRTGSVAVAMIDELSLKNIPFRILGSTKLIYDEPVSKFLLAHLILSMNDSDTNSIFEIAPSLYIPRKLLMSILDNSGQLSLNSILPDLGRPSKASLIERIKLIQYIPTLPLSSAIESLLSDETIKQYLGLNDNSVESEEVSYIIDQLKLSSSRFKSTQDFLDFVADLKRKTSSDADVNKDSITLSSIHSSKGLEFKHVFLIGAVEGIIPHKHSIDPISKIADDIQVPSPPPDIDEELRILYVAVTRAKENLTITYPKQLGTKETQVSRFLAPFID